MDSPGVLSARQRLAPYLEKLTVVRVDRLDPSKNQIIGFKAFGRLLELRPDLRGPLRFLAFLVPSRTDLGVYREYREAVYAAIREVNAAYAQECGFDPIEVFYTNDREQALAAMEQCDALLVNSREDGMNLVVKEWAVVSKRPGVVILSETCGVASEIGADALMVSPLDIEGTAQALAQAIDMSNEERWARLAGIRAKVHSWTAAHWLSAQLDALHQVSPGPSAFNISGRAQASCGASEPVQPCRPRPAPAAGRSVRKVLVKASNTSRVKIRGETLRINQ
jgi:trehalose 6-phosphate synthase